jgi:hypothetical protein
VAGGCGLAWWSTTGFLCTSVITVACFQEISFYALSALSVCWTAAKGVAKGCPMIVWARNRSSHCLSCSASALCTGHWGQRVDQGQSSLLYSQPLGQRREPLTDNYKLIVRGGYPHPQGSACTVGGGISLQGGATHTLTDSSVQCCLGTSCDRHLMNCMLHSCSFVRIVERALRVPVRDAQLVTTGTKAVDLQLACSKRHGPACWLWFWF